MMPIQKTDISVCIPTYNSAKTLRACLDSIFRQTVKPKEVLICDGNSTDKTLEILKEYPVKIVATDVKGVGSARNVLASAASGKKIAWIDSDVAIPVNWLELREKIHRERPEIDCLSNLTGFMDIKEAIEKSKIPISLEKIVLNPSKEISQAALTVKRDVIQRAGGYDPLFEWGEEWDLRIRLLRVGAKLYRTETCLAYHIRSKRFLKRSRSDLTPRDLIFAGNFLCFLSKYGPWYIRHNPRHFVTFLLRLWLLYSLLGMVILFVPAFISLCLAGLTNLVACKIHHKKLRPGFLSDQILKALGEHRNLLRSIVYRYRRKYSDTLQCPRSRCGKA